MLYPMLTNYYVHHTYPVRHYITRRGLEEYIVTDAVKECKA